MLSADNALGVLISKLWVIAVTMGAPVIAWLYQVLVSSELLHGSLHSSAAQGLASLAFSSLLSTPASLQRLLLFS